MRFTFQRHKRVYWKPDKIYQSFMLAYYQMSLTLILDDLFYSLELIRTSTHHIVILQDKSYLGLFSVRPAAGKLIYVYMVVIFS
jgi:hypothetical protein